MKTTIAKWATKAAGASAIALLLATPAVAQSRGDWNRNDDQRTGSYDNRDNRDNHYNNSRETYRENQRVQLSGKVRSFTHERDGYRIQLEGNEHSFWVPESNFRGRQLRTGISIGFGGVFRSGAIYVDAVTWPGEAYGNSYNSVYLRGVVERVDYRDATLRIRDDRGRIIVVDVNGRYGREGLRGFRRGDRVRLSGQWLRGDIFGADRIDRR